MNSDPIVSDLQPSAVLVYELATHDLPRRTRETMLTLLSTEERRALGGIVNDSRKVEYLASRYLQRHLIARHSKISPESLRFELNAHGKPSVCVNGETTRRGAVDFNLSHCTGKIVIALGVEDRTRKVAGLGIDVERYPPRHRVDRIIKRFFSPTESAALLELTPSKRKLAFLRSWTRKEAVVKALGDGIAFGLSNFSVATHPSLSNKAQAIDWHVGAPGDFVIFDLDFAPPFIGAVCVPASVDRIVRCPGVLLPA